MSFKAQPARIRTSAHALLASTRPRFGNLGSPILAPSSTASMYFSCRTLRSKDVE